MADGDRVPLVLCVCTDSVSEVVEGVGMVTMAVVTVSPWCWWGPSLLLLALLLPPAEVEEAAAVSPAVVSDVRERVSGVEGGRTWMSLSSSRSGSWPLPPPLAVRFCKTEDELIFLCPSLLR